MTQYLLSVHHTGEPANASLPPEEMEVIFKAVDAFNEELQATGVWVFAGGLEAPDTATMVDATKGDVLISDGPYAESKEQLGGFWIVEVADLDAALALAARGSAACREPVEVRPFQGEPAPES